MFIYNDSCCCSHNVQFWSGETCIYDSSSYPFPSFTAVLPGIESNSSIILELPPCRYLLHATAKTCNSTKSGFTDKQSPKVFTELECFTIFTMTLTTVFTEN